MWEFVGDEINNIFIFLVMVEETCVERWNKLSEKRAESRA
jgi:hypothetical protein